MQLSRIVHEALLHYLVYHSFWHISIRCFVVKMNSLIGLDMSCLDIMNINILIGFKYEIMLPEHESDEFFTNVLGTEDG